MRQHMTGAAAVAAAVNYVEKSRKKNPNDILQLSEILFRFLFVMPYLRWAALAGTHVSSKTNQKLFPNTLFRPLR